MPLQIKGFKQPHHSLPYFEALLSYDSATGYFYWLVNRQKITAGRVAGFKEASGYISIEIDGSSYKAHRLAWLFYYGVWPNNQIDHKNRKRSQNWINNLREATRSQNTVNSNKRSDCSSGITGVSRCSNKYKKWKVQIRKHDGLLITKTFSSKTKAGIFYRQERRRVFGDFAL